MLERIHLRTILAIEERGSLTAAAEELSVTQSALSHTIRKLENKLGTEIWLREGRSLRLTQTGEYLLSIAQRVLPQLEHAEHRLEQLAQGERGTLNIGMECHPCYRWLLKVVSPFLDDWPDVDVDVKQKFQFGGVDALLTYEIDLLVTPDPVYKNGLRFEPVFNYEQVLVTAKDHPLAGRKHISPKDLCDQVLLTYPVSQDRLDVYTDFLRPEGLIPKHHKTIETTDIILQMVASGRGVAALPRWLVEEYASMLPLQAVSFGPKGISKHIFLGTRERDEETEYLRGFISLALSF